jgi:hypothetical protein
MPKAATTPVRLLTPTEFAAEVGVSKQAVNDLLRRNVIVRNEVGLIDVELAKLALQHRLRPGSKIAAALASTASGAQPAAQEPAQAATAPPAGTTDTSFNAARTEREWEEAAISKLRRQQMEGAVIERESATRTVFTLARGLRDSLTPIGRRLAAKAAALTEPHAIDQLYTAELRVALDAFCAKALPQAAAEMAGDAAAKTASILEPYRSLVGHLVACQQSLDELKRSLPASAASEPSNTALDSAASSCRAALDQMPLLPPGQPEPAHGTA